MQQITSKCKRYILQIHITHHQMKHKMSAVRILKPALGNTSIQNIFTSSSIAFTDWVRNTKG